MQNTWVVPYNLKNKKTKQPKFLQMRHFKKKIHGPNMKCFSIAPVIREIHIKITIDTDSHTLAPLKLKWLTIPNADDDVEQLELSYIADKYKMMQPPGENFGSFLYT